VTTHVALTARAFGSSGLILTDVEDKSLKANLEKTIADWGGCFTFEMGVPWKKAIAEWKKNGGTTIHLTMYGQNINEAGLMEQIRSLKRDVLVMVGSQKVPPDFFSEKFSDYNIAVGGQPHSEIAALAVFLDRMFQGKQLSTEFEHARIKVLPSKRGKCLADSDKDKQPA